MQAETPKETPETTQFYTWKGYRCAYETHRADAPGVPLVLVHPIGVGLSCRFWDRFCQSWQQAAPQHPIFNPDLLGCGESDMPRVAYRPEDHAAQLQHFLREIVVRPATLVVQGALFPVAIALLQRSPDLVSGLVLSGPPSWPVMTTAAEPWQSRAIWNGFFDSPIGGWFYRYARRENFLQSFSIRQLFASEAGVDREWLDALQRGARDLASRYAVFSFLASFWRQDYGGAIATIPCPTLVLVGDRASSISRSGFKESPEERLQKYLEVLPKGSGKIVPGRNVLPYEQTAGFVEAIAPFVRSI